MEAFEELRLIGWFDDMWQSEVTEQEMLCLSSNMAGNAYSLYHKGPWLMAAFATYGSFAGKYGVRAGPMKQAPQPSSSSSSSSESDDSGEST